MELSGQILSGASPEVLASALGNPDILRRLMPEGSTLDQTRPGQFVFSVERSLGPVKLTLPGKLSMTPTGRGHDLVLAVRAAHIIGGKVNLDLRLTFDARGQQTRLSYSGEVTASGLAATVMGERHVTLNAALKRFFTGLRMQAETQSRQRSSQA